MNSLSRRQFSLSLGAAGLAALSLPISKPAIAAGQAKIIIIGGGPAGATVANRLRQADPALSVTLVEQQSSYTTCFYSNLYLGDFLPFESLVHSYEGLAKRGITHVAQRAEAIDAEKKRVVLADGSALDYDKLVVAPGISLKYEKIEGYSAEAAEIMPHAWKGGTQTTLLKKLLTSMDDGGLVVMAAPPAPYRCPPGPYERACMIAHYLKSHKPKSKLIIFDPKKTYSKQEVFDQAFVQYYKGIVELDLTNEIDDFTVVRVDPKTGEIVTKAGRTEKAAVANIIPPQKAGDIAHQAGLAEGDWCPIDPANFRSTKAADIYVLGDAAISADMPKSAFSAHSQAGVVAEDILTVLSGKPEQKGQYRNTCWSLLAPNDSVKIGADYAPGTKDGKAILAASNPFISKVSDTSEMRKENFDDSLAWYNSVVAEMFAK